MKTLHSLAGKESMGTPIDMRSAPVSLDELVAIITTAISSEWWTDVVGEGLIGPINLGELRQRAEPIVVFDCHYA